MRERIWIDGFNVFHHWKRTRRIIRGAGDIGGRRRRALHRVAEALGGWRRRATVFLDGGPRREGSAAWGLRVEAAGPGRKADDLMVEAIRAEPRRARSVTAVSNDRDLGLRLREEGAEVIAVEAFFDALARRDASRPAGADSAAAAGEAERHGPLAEDEVAMWMEVFGFSEEEDPPRADR
jgi:hypothetical protein